MPGKKEAEALRREQILWTAFRVAEREGLEQLTVRLVAAEAKLSTGLVFFHFKSKEALLLDLLDWLLSSFYERWNVSEELAPTERLLSFLQMDLQDVQQSNEGREGRARLELLISYWGIATHNPIINERIQQAIEASRQELRPIIQSVIESEPERYHSMTAESFVTVILAMTLGCAIQSLLRGQRIDIDQILAVMRALLQPSASNT